MSTVLERLRVGLSLAMVPFYRLSWTSFSARLRNSDT